jgi:MinD superfamily P-loop ATPase
MVICIASGKGGPGKTTIAANPARDFRKYDVVFEGPIAYD